LTRNHMIHSINLGVIPPDDMPLPPEVEWNYMANPEEIIARAKIALALYESTPEFAEIKGIKTKDKDLANLIAMLPARVTSLREAIEKRDYVHCRRDGRDPQYYVDLVKETAKKCGLVSRAGEQVSLFDLMGCG